MLDKYKSIIPTNIDDRPSQQKSSLPPPFLPGSKLLAGESTSDVSLNVGCCGCSFKQSRANCKI